MNRILSDEFTPAVQRSTYRMSRHNQRKYRRVADSETLDAVHPQFRVDNCTQTTGISALAHTSRIEGLEPDCRHLPPP